MDEAVEKEPDHKDLEKGFCQLHEGTLREDTAESVDWIQLVQFELDGLRVEVESHLEKVDRKPDQHDEDHDGKRGLGKNDDNTDEDAEDILRVHRLIQIAEHIGCIGRNREIDGVPQQFQRKETDEQHKRAVDFLTAGNLPLLACVGALFRRRFLRLFARKTLEVKDESVPIGGLAPQAIYFHTFH